MTSEPKREEPAHIRLMRERYDRHRPAAPMLTRITQEQALREIAERHS